jgi:zona occludens toxin (predicted ATPase)
VGRREQRRNQERKRKRMEEKGRAKVKNFKDDFKAHGKKEYGSTNNTMNCSSSLSSSKVLLFLQLVCYTCSMGML